MVLLTSRKPHEVRGRLHLCISRWNFVDVAVTQQKDVRMCEGWVFNTMLNSYAFLSVRVHKSLCHQKKNKLEDKMFWIWYLMCPISPSRPYMDGLYASYTSVFFLSILQNCPLKDGLPGAEWGAELFDFSRLHESPRDAHECLDFLPLTWCLSPRFWWLSLQNKRPWILIGSLSPERFWTGAENSSRRAWHLCAHGCWRCEILE